jgi:hypothetical protein
MAIRCRTRCVRPNGESNMNLTNRRTIASILLQGTQETSNDEWTDYRCGCRTKDHNKWWLCTYHEGYNDALDEDGIEAP